MSDFELHKQICYMAMGDGGEQGSVGNLFKAATGTLCKVVLLDMNA